MRGRYAYKKNFKMQPNSKLSTEQAQLLNVLYNAIDKNELATVQKHAQNKEEYPVIKDHVRSLLSYAAQFTQPLRTQIMATLISCAKPLPNIENSKDKATPLTVAAQHENLEAAEFLIRALPKDVNVQDSNGRTALHYAIQNRDAQMVQFLIDNNANVNAQDSNGRTALHYAIRNNNAKMVEFLIAKGADVNLATNNKETPLMLAANSLSLPNPEPILQILLENHADTLQKNERGHTAWQIARASGAKSDDLNMISSKEKKQIQEKLLSEFARTLDTIQTTNSVIETMLQFAITMNDENIVQRLLDKNIDKKIVEDAFKNNENASQEIRDLLKNHLAKPNPSPQNADKTQPQTLLYAAQKKDLVLWMKLATNSESFKDCDKDHLLCLVTQNNWHLAINLLVKNGANVNTRGKGDKTPLMIAAETGNFAAYRALLRNSADIKKCDVNHLLCLVTQNNWTDAMDALVKNGANVNARGKGDKTPLMIAAETGNLTGYRFLLSNGANIDASDKDHLLCLVTQNNWTDAMDALVKNGANVNARGKGNKTPLMIAAETGKLAAYKNLLLKGANIDASDKDHLLCLVTQNNWTDAMDALVKNGANVHTRGKGDKTPLMIAAEKGNLAACQFLLSKGADIHARDTNGNTALMLAVKKGKIDTIRTLISAGADIHAVNVFGETALILAAKKTEEITQELLRHGAKVEHKDKKGRTALQTAILNGYGSIAQILLNKTDDTEELRNAALIALENKRNRLASLILKRLPREQQDELKQSISANSSQKEPDKSIAPSTTTKNSDSMLNEMIAQLHPHMLYSAYINTTLQTLIAPFIDLQEIRTEISNMGINDSKISESEWIFLDAAAKGYEVSVEQFLTTQNDTIKPTKASINAALILSATKGHSAVMNSLLKAGAQASLYLIFQMLFAGKTKTAFILMKSIVSNLSFISKSSPEQIDNHNSQQPDAPQADQAPPLLSQTHELDKNIQNREKPIQSPEVTQRRQSFEKAALTNDSNTLQTFLQESNKDLIISQNDKNSALRHAAIRGHMDAARTLLENGSRFNWDTLIGTLLAGQIKMAYRLYILDRTHQKSVDATAQKDAETGATPKKLPDAKNQTERDKTSIPQPQKPSSLFQGQGISQDKPKSNL